MSIQATIDCRSGSDRPRSLAIAGAWGYIGQKFLDAALKLGIRTSVYDPGSVPTHMDLSNVQQFDDETAFFHSDADVFHLATQPQYRRRGLGWLLERPPHRQPLILNEKPMAAPNEPEECLRVERAVEAAGATMLFDFPELYDELTDRILDFLGRFRQVTIREAFVMRSKDREDPSIARNFKPMFPIEYQESVHCLAFLLHIVGRLHGKIDDVLDAGISVEASSEPYVPPNPQDYLQTVDGRCQFELTLGTMRARGDTNFKRGAPWAKRRELRGLADGQPFEIVVDYLEGNKRLTINGEPHAVDPHACSYQQVLKTAWRWYRDVGPAATGQGVYPNPRFARYIYQLASVLWRSAQDRSRIELATSSDLLGFDEKRGHATFS